MMRLINNSGLPRSTVMSIVRATRPGGISNFDVRISTTKRGLRGKAYTRGSSYHSTADPFVIVQLPKTDRECRCIRKARGAYLRVVIGSKMEALIYVLAHELRHLWQANHRIGRVWGSRGKFSERDASAYGIRMLRRFRRGELEMGGAK
jgi:hypothetical protein